MRKIAVILSFLIATVVAQGQLVVTTGMTPTQYVQNVLLGAGITVSNVTFSGNNNQIGEFNATNTNPFLGLTNGIVMATGDVNVAVGPNNTGSASLGGGNFGVGDPDLDVLVGGAVGTNDAAILEFDFIPTGDTIKFNFVFGSEEYPEYVNSINDAFGFFLSGPGIAGPFTNNAQNIALVPNTPTPITINTVNSGSNPSYYVDNTVNSGPQSIQFDGYTTVITAVGVVQCGVQYHIKIAIADASDDAWDSGVFLEAGSFSSNTVTLNSNIDINGNDSILYEGCGSAFLDFVRDNTNDTSVYHFTITGTAGTSDYNISADSVLFLPGQDSVTLTFDALQDGLTEPLETVTIMLIQTICNKQDTQMVTFYIADYPPINFTVNDTLIPCGSNDSVPLFITASGPPFDILWNTGATTDTIWVKPTATTNYWVTLTDTCGVNSYTDTATVIVQVAGPINIVTPSISKYCPQDSVWVYANVTSPGVFTYNWTPGGAGDSILVSPNFTTTYYLTVTDDCGSTKNDSVIVNVPVYVPLTNTVTTPDTSICSGHQVVLNAQINGGVGTYYSWDNGLGSSLPAYVNPTQTTNYILTAQDSCGAIAVDSVLVTVIIYPPLELVTSNDTLVCVGKELDLFALASGGEGTYYYNWEGMTSPSIHITANYDKNYHVTVTDGCGEKISDVVTITTTRAHANFTYEYVSEYEVEFTDSSYYNIVNNWWSFNPVDSTLELNPSYTYPTPGDHEVWLAVKDDYGCYDTIVKTIYPPLIVYAPNAITPDGDGLNDVFKFKGMGIEQFNMMIFNRWGELLFESNDIDEGWDATYKGNPVQNGVYIYRVRAVSYSLREYETAGSVNVLR